MKKKFISCGLILVLIIICCNVNSQSLQPGFDKNEYKNLLCMSARISSDTTYLKDIPEPIGFNRVYQSPVMGLDNLWNLWIDTNNKTAVISIRGTTVKQESWLANFYAAMVPAEGSLILGKQDKFAYKLAENPKAAIHIGWLISMSYLSKDILPKLDSCYTNGIKNFILMGHSQGGAITYLLTAYLYQLQKENKIPTDIRFKTYCSAGPKPGNLFFAYDYENITKNGWAYNVINSADWVPETPISIQTLNDFNNTNPFINAKTALRKQKFPKNILLRYVYNQLDKPTKKAQRKYEKYLGKMASKMIRNTLPNFTPPHYYKSNYYVRTGATIVLKPDEEYYKIYPDDEKKVFVHHFHPPYLYLIDKYE
jgi:hypothetical protein